MSTGSSFNALFCTAQIPTSTINELPTHAHDNTISGNIFCVIQTVDQRRVDKPTYPPIALFQTTFQDFTIEGLGAFCKEKIDWNNPKSQLPYISDNEPAVLDPRTLDDGTVLLFKYDHWDERIDPDSPSDMPDAFRKCEDWRQIRMEMKSAPIMMKAPQEIITSQIFDSVRDRVYRTQKKRMKCNQNAGTVA